MEQRIEHRKKEKKTREKKNEKKRWNNTTYIEKEKRKPVNNLREDTHSIKQQPNKQYVPKYSSLIRSSTVSVPLSNACFNRAIAEW